MIHRLIFIVLTIFVLLESTSGSIEEDNSQVFAEDGESRMKPAKTLQALRKLSDAYSNDDCIDCDKSKREVDRLIAISEASEEKCSQKSVDHINKLLQVYAKNKLNLVPYLQYYKKHLIEICEDQFDVTHLRWDSAGSNYWSDNNTDLKGDSSQSKVSHDKNDRLKEQATERDSKLKRESEEKYSQELERHRESNEGWIKKYKQILLDASATTKQPKKLLNDLIRLDKDRVNTFGLNDSANLKKVLDSLIGLRYYSVFSCNKKQFDIFHTLRDESIKQGYNRSIKSYIDYYQDAFWKKCKNAFLKAQKQPSQLFKDDQAEVSSFLDNLPVQTGTNNKKDRLNFGATAIQESLVNYSEKKLFGKPHSDEEINSLFEDTIEPLCEAIELRFTNLRELSEVIEENENFVNELDEKSLEWMGALKFCTMINDNPDILERARLLISKR